MDLIPYQFTRSPTVGFRSSPSSNTEASQLAAAGPWLVKVNIREGTKKTRSSCVLESLLLLKQPIFTGSVAETIAPCCRL